MKVEVIVRIDGREVGTLQHPISGTPLDMEQQTAAVCNPLKNLACEVPRIYDPAGIETCEWCQGV